MPTSIEFENISKQYRLGLVSTNTLSHDLKRWWVTNIQGKEDPYLKIGEVNDRATKGQSDYVWALKDINFKVEQGDVLGIIGKNGAGKSTLLKILSKVTTPSTGSIRARGRIASLLEVGTGFHPEMTGRENIYMNGAIMGMTKAEITRKLNEIVDFSGVERYLDTPVKRYSSGMTVRLGFAIAAHLDPEILVVDEVLAVGDAEFQKKAIGKMQDVSKGEGRTVLFVSHNMAAVKNLCKTALIMQNGTITEYGQVQPIINRYLEESTQSKSEYIVPESKRKGLTYVEKVIIQNKSNEPSKIIPLLETFSIKVYVRVKDLLPHFIVGLGITTNDNVSLHTSFSKPIEITEGLYEYTFHENEKYYTSGKYNLNIGLSSRENTIFYLEDFAYIEFDDKYDKDIIVSNKVGYILNPMLVKSVKI